MADKLIRYGDGITVFYSEKVVFEADKQRSYELRDRVFREKLQIGFNIIKLRYHDRQSSVTCNIKII